MGEQQSVIFKFKGCVLFSNNFLPMWFLFAYTLMHKLWMKINVSWRFALKCFLWNNFLFKTKLIPENCYLTLAINDLKLHTKCKHWLPRKLPYISCIYFWLLSYKFHIWFTQNWTEPGHWLEYCLSLFQVISSRTFPSPSVPCRASELSTCLTTRWQCCLVSCGRCAL